MCEYISSPQSTNLSKHLLADLPELKTNNNNCSQSDDPKSGDKSTLRLDPE